MSFVPFAAIWVFLILAAIVCRVAKHRKVRDGVSLAAPIIGLILWYLFRPSDPYPSLGLAGRQWVMTETAWHLTGIALLTLLAAAVALAVQRPDGIAGQQAGLTNFLAAATLPAVWAADDRTRVLSVSVFVLVLVFCRWRNDRERPALDPSALWPATSVVLLWLGSATPTLESIAVLLAAATLMGVWPFAGWPKGSGDVPALSMMTAAMPVIAAAALLGGVLASLSFGPIAIIVATTTGLLSLIVGLIRVWNQPSGGLFNGLQSGLAGVVLLAAVWAGAPALPPAVRLAAFIPALLMFRQAGQEMHQPASSVSGPGAGRLRLPTRQVAAAVAYLTLAGMPLTVGFTTLSILYEAWQDWGGVVLALVMVLVLSLWLATIVLAGRESVNFPSAGHDARLQAATLVIPVIGLMQLPAGVSTISAATWMAIIAAAGAGALLGRFLPGLESLGSLLQESMTLPASAGRIRSQWRRFHSLAANAVSDALEILQGDFGLLWLLGLVLLLLWLG